MTSAGKCKGHAKTADIDCGRSTEIDRAGNAAADKAAKSGRKAHLFNAAATARVVKMTNLVRLVAKFLARLVARLADQTWPGITRPSEWRKSSQEQPRLRSEREPQSRGHHLHQHDDSR